MIRLCNKQKGFALVTSLLLLLLMTVMGIAMTSRSNLNTNMSVENDRSQHVFFAAEAGIEHARRYLENSGSNNIYPSNLNPPTTTSGAITGVPANRCLADYQDGIGAQQYDTLGDGRYAYRFPETQNGETMGLNNTCVAINANPNLEVNYRRMECEVASNNADINQFLRSFGFSYYIFFEGQSSGAASSNIGTGVVGTSTEYAAGTQGTAYHYKVISCGAGFNRPTGNNPAALEQMVTVEARVRLSN